MNVLRLLREISAPASDLQRWGCDRSIKERYGFIKKVNTFQPLHPRQHQPIEFILWYSSKVKNPLLSRSALLKAGWEIPALYASWRLIWPLPSRSMTVNSALDGDWARRWAGEAKPANSARASNFIAGERWSQIHNRSRPLAEWKIFTRDFDWFYLAAMFLKAFCWYELNQAVM